MAIRVCKGKYNISKDDKIDYTFLEVDDNNKFIIVIDKDEKPKYYIYKNKNLLIYAPICLCGMWYVIENVPVISGNIILKVVLIALPIILYVLGRVTNKAEEIEMLRPVKEKHERK